MERPRSTTSYIRSVALVAILAPSIMSHGAAAAAANNCNSAKSNTSGVTSAQAVGTCADARPCMASVARFPVPRAVGDSILAVDVALEQIPGGIAAGNTTTDGADPACSPEEPRNEQAGNPADGWRFAPGGSAQDKMR
jgi:hypothetical protein